MIKRQYFICFDVIKNNNTASRHFRQFWVKSWFRKNPGAVLNGQMEKYSGELEIKIEDIFVTSFNDLR